VLGRDAGGGTRTRNPVRRRPPKAAAFTSFATPASKLQWGLPLSCRVDCRSAARQAGKQVLARTRRLWKRCVCSRKSVRLRGRLNVCSQHSRTCRRSSRSLFANFSARNPRPFTGLWTDEYGTAERLPGSYCDSLGHFNRPSAKPLAKSGNVGRGPSLSTTFLLQTRQRPQDR